MDPISVAATRFLRELARGYKRRPSAVARLLAREPDRADVLKILRLNEHGGLERRPLFLHDSPFESPAPYFEALVARIVADHALVRKGLSEDGISIPPVETVPRSAAVTPEAHAIAIASAAAERLTLHLDGAFVVLAPAKIMDAEEWRQSIDRLTRTSRVPTLRIAVLDLARSVAPPRPLVQDDGLLAPVLGPQTATFDYDIDDLFDFAEQQISRMSAGPAPRTPELPRPNALTAIGLTGAAIPDAATATAIHTLFLRAARAAAKNDTKSAIDTYRRARDLCRDECLFLHEVAAVFALAGAYLSAGSDSMATASYGQASLLAAEQKHWPIACQAKLGEAGTSYMGKHWSRAAAAYAEAAALAERGNLVPLQIEALRMQGICLLHRGDESAALARWRRAIDVGTAADEPTRRASTFPQVVESLSAVLEHRGMREQAAHLRSLLDKTDKGSAAGG